jgi:hypothetical protein
MPLKRLEEKEREMEVFGRKFGPFIHVVSSSLVL